MVEFDSLTPIKPLLRALRPDKPRLGDASTHKGLIGVGEAPDWPTCCRH